MEDIFAIIFIFGGGTLTLLSFSPVGRALAERIRSRGGDESAREILAEVEGLRQEIAELQERVDFAERVLLQSRDRVRLGHSGSAE